MKIKISTLVNKNYLEVSENFDKSLLEKLNPPFMPFQLTRYDGSRKDDQVHIDLGAGIFKQQWISYISEDSKDLEEVYFVDEGIKLPFFLKKWKHKHRILKRRNRTEIIDDIYYQTPFLLLDYLIYPGMFYLFFYRKKIYREFFR